MKRMTNETAEQAQESMWIEIIRQMERMYAQLANSQSELEDKGRELLEAKEFTDNIIRSIVDGLIAVDSAGSITMVNRATLELLGYEEPEVIGQSVEIFFDDTASREKLFYNTTKTGRLLRDYAIRDLEVVCRSKSGEKIPMTFSGSSIRNANGEIVGAVAVAKDLRETKRLLAEAAAVEAERAKAAEMEKAYRELKELQAQLIHAEKMASLGKLAAGVAHEINNPLGSILLYSQLVLEDIPAGGVSSENLEKIIRQTTRCKDIVKGLLDFARQAEPSISPCRINLALEETLSLLQSQSIFRNISITKRINEEMPSLLLDGAQLQQVFINIILNAAEAMQGQGELQITADLAGEGKSVEIEISDTGCGIPEELLDKIFEPFFTTKKVGEGTGLGLAICYGIVRRNSGTIAVRSEEGKGTKFTIRFPVPDRR